MQRVVFAFLVTFGMTFVMTAVIACGQVTDHSDPPALDPTALEVATKLYCEEGKKLVEDRVALNVTFDRLTEQSQIFAFANDNGPCIVSEDIEHTWPSDPDPMSFKLKLHGKCLPNNSVWRAIGTQKGNDQTYMFRRVATSSWPSLEMTGSKNLAGSYVGGLTGLRVLVCQ